MNASFSLCLLLLLTASSASASTPSPTTKASTAHLPHGVSSMLSSLSKTMPVPSSLHSSPHTPTLSPSMPHTSPTNYWTNAWSMHCSTTCHGAMSSTVFSQDATTGAEVEATDSTFSKWANYCGSPVTRTCHIHRWDSHENWFQLGGNTTP